MSSAPSRARRGLLLLGALAAALLPAMALHAQSLTGTTGLVSIPTAEMQRDGALTVGTTLVDRRFNRLGYREDPAFIQFATLGFLPFAEVSVRLTRPLGEPGWAFGDRTVSLRVRLVEEGRFVPAMVAGGHDLGGTRYHHALYVVASKQVRAEPIPGTLGLHLGYGHDWGKLRAAGHDFMGTFGGVSLSPRPWVSLLAEYDGDRPSVGVRLRSFRRLTLLGALKGMDGPSGGISYTHPLK